MRKDKKLMREALADLLEQQFPGDPQQRTGAQLLALATFREALSGNLQAAKEITTRVEGRVADHVEETEPIDPTTARERIQVLLKKLRGEDAPMQPPDNQ